MTEFEERLTHEFSTLAAHYAQEQQQLSDQVSRLAEQVQHLADQQSADPAAVYHVEQNLGGAGRTPPTSPSALADPSVRPPVNTMSKLRHLGPKSRR